MRGGLYEVIQAMNYELFLTDYDPSYIEPAVSDEPQPVRYTFYIQGQKNLSAKVIKSKNASVELPELDVRILPGLNSKDLVCDVFGLLSRIEVAINHSVDSEKKDWLLQNLSEIKEGKLKTPLVLIDPSGLSVIMGGAIKEILNT